MLSNGNNYIEPNAIRLRAVDGGYFYRGKVDTDPTFTANQIPIYYKDESGTEQQVEQPIYLNKAGVPVLKNGNAFEPISSPVFSFSLFDKTGKLIEYNASTGEPANMSEVIESQDKMMGYTLKGNYAAGILLATSSDYVWYDGERWFAVNAPYTTTAKTPDTDENITNDNHHKYSSSTIHSVSSIQSAPRYIGYRIKLISYHTPNTAAELPYTQSGGDFVYMDYPRSMHDGGLVISPTVPTTQPFTNDSLTDFLNGVGDTDPDINGVWVRVDGCKNLSTFGADPTGNLFCDRSFEVARDTLYVVDTLGQGQVGCSIEATQGVYRFDLPIVYDKDYIKVWASGENDVVFWKPESNVRTDLGTNIAPLRDGKIIDSYNVNANVIYTHPDDAFRFGSEFRGIRLSGKSDDPAQSLTKYNEYGIYAPRAALVTTKSFSCTRIGQVYFTHDTWKHTAEDIQTNFGGGVFQYEADVDSDGNKYPTGTSLAALNCFASRPLTEAGIFPSCYDFDGLDYSTLTACSADNSFEPWRITDSNLHIDSGSTEIARSSAALVISGGVVELTNWRSVSPSQTQPNQVWIKNGAEVDINGMKLSGKVTPQPDDTGIRVDSGSIVRIKGYTPPTTGTPWEFVLDGANPAKSVVVTDEYGIDQIFTPLQPDGVYNAPTATASIGQLGDASLSINTLHKSQGRQAYIPSSGKTAVASGSAPTAAWVDAMGTVIVTPS
ncbi:MAG: hypothetical protein GY893_10440 [bacterium]|nr:hypothetical protein [bacterium]